MRSLSLALFCAACITACQTSTETTTKWVPPPMDQSAELDIPPERLMQWGDLTQNPLPKTGIEIRTGTGATDIVDLWLPEGDGPHPVVVMVHGGCWQKSIADRTLMNYAAEDLRRNGMAVWNIEYRGVDEKGGGYPGTYLDVARAVDALPDFAEAYDLDLSRVAGIGHSAGGHLVTWLSTRSNIPATSPLYAENPQPLSGVVNTGGLADLETSAPVTFAGCLADIMETLVGSPGTARPDVFSDTSPVNLFPTETLQVSVNGAEDSIAPPELGRGYTEKAEAAGVTAAFHEIPGTGHVELVSPGTAAWTKQREILLEFLSD